MLWIGGSRLGSGEVDGALPWTVGDGRWGKAGSTGSHMGGRRGRSEANLLDRGGAAWFFIWGAKKKPMTRNSSLSKRTHFLALRHQTGKDFAILTDLQAALTRIQLDVPQTGTRRGHRDHQTDLQSLQKRQHLNGEVCLRESRGHRQRGPRGLQEEHG